MREFTIGGFLPTIKTTNQSACIQILFYCKSKLAVMNGRPSATVLPMVGGAISNPPSDARFDYSSYLPYKAKNLGKSGDTAETLEERFDQEVLPFKPKYLLIMGGSNSLRGGTSASDVIESLSAISKKCQDNNIRPIFLTLPPINPERIQRVFNEPTVSNWKTELAKVNAFIKNQPDYVDIYPSLVDEQGLLPVKYAQDGLHLDISGKKIIGRKVSDYIKEHSL